MNEKSQVGVMTTHDHKPETSKPGEPPPGPDPANTPTGTPNQKPTGKPGQTSGNP